MLHLAPMRAGAVTVVAIAACGVPEAPEDLEHGAHYGELYDRAGIGKADGLDCTAYAAPDRPGFGGRVALTFDDGPDSGRTPRVVDTLRRYGAPATFFVVGGRVPGYRPGDPSAALAELAADPLFSIGNHSWSHANLATAPMWEVEDEVDSTTAVLEASDLDPRLFRFPYGIATCEALDYVEGAAGYRNVGWHVDSADWCFASGGVCTPDEFRLFEHVPVALQRDMVGFLLHQLEATDGGIVLFHDIHGFTADHLDDVLFALERAGYTFTSLDDIEAFPRLGGDETAPARTVARLGDACETDADCDLGLPAYLGRCHPAGFCTRACEGLCPGAGTFCVEDPAAGRRDPGICVQTADSSNGDCELVPDTQPAIAERYVGASGVPPVSRRVCVPLDPERG